MRDHDYVLGAAPHPADRAALLDDADLYDTDRPDPADLARHEAPTRHARSYAHEDPWAPPNDVGAPEAHEAATRAELGRQYAAWQARRGAA